MDSARPWRGVFTIPCTPFTEQGALDRDGGVSKAVLKRRGIIASDYTRQLSGNPLDRYDRMELDRLLEDLEDLFTLAPLQSRLAG